MPNITKADPLATIPALSAQFGSPPGAISWPSVESWRHWDREPLPADVTPARIAATEAQIALTLAPIAPAEMASRVEALRAHYGEWSDLPPALARQMNEDWLADFSGYPARLFAQACSLWRNSTAKRAPTPGQLKELVEPELLRIRHLAWQLQRARQHVQEPAQSAGDEPTATGATVADLAAHLAKRDARGDQR